MGWVTHPGTHSQGSLELGLKPRLSILRGHSLPVPSASGVSEARADAGPPALGGDCSYTTWWTGDPMTQDRRLREVR